MCRGGGILSLLDVKLNECYLNVCIKCHLLFLETAMLRVELKTNLLSCH